ncbi:MAG: DUF1512 domain-containing protein [Desulfurococcaceae archaeon]|nr:DUF1512 domain-containing protein [Sulfolobales archaeon]MDW8170163.1 DUF1512 domain-containing protein [Desulfurococcaceae archaeon]
MADSSWLDYVWQLMFITFFIMIITGTNQRIQMKIWIYDIRSKLNVIRSYAESSRAKIIDALRKLGARDPEYSIAKYIDFFAISPVEIEPIDIIKRLDHILRTEERAIKNFFEKLLPNAGKYERSLLESSLEVAIVLNYLYKVIRHYILLGEKQNNWVLIMQLQLQMPEIMKVAATYYKALDAFMSAKPVGDSVGAIVAYRLIEESNVLSRKIVEDTAIVEARLASRRVFIIKAEGPGSNVGKPGKVLSDLVEEFNGNIDLVITVDAALKLEGEEDGEISEGVGAAIGDPGPEKIAIERATAKYNIPLRALVIKMDLASALKPLKKELYEAAERAVDYVKRLIVENTLENATVIVAGIGNTVGVAQ